MTAVATRKITNPTWHPGSVQVLLISQPKTMPAPANQTSLMLDPLHPGSLGVLDAPGGPAGEAGQEPPATREGCSISRVVTRRSSRRYFVSSNGRARCIVARLSQITRSPGRHEWR